MPLYKYAPFPRIDVLKNGLIRFTQPTAFNDPFELFPFFESIAPESDIENYLKKHKWDENEINQMLEDSWNKELKKLPELNIPFPLVKNMIRNGFEHTKPLFYELMRNFMGMKGRYIRKLVVGSILSAINNSIGILCLSETPDNILMWSHYSANHTGLVFEFDDTHHFFDQRQKENELRGHIKKVQYSKNRPKMTIFNPSLSNEENIDIWIKDFIWIKSYDWEYEKEWRIIQTFKDWKGVIRKAESSIYLYPFPMDCIKSVIVGCRSQDEDLASLKSLLKSDTKYSHIVLKQASTDEEKYKINIKTIDI
jgi:hypothetical protein